MADSFATDVEGARRRWLSEPSTVNRRASAETGTDTIRSNPVSPRATYRAVSAGAGSDSLFDLMDRREDDPASVPSMSR
jgi:hypothetical protein